MALGINTPFIWGRHGEMLTPEQVARKRELAELALAKAGDTSPVGHWTQGAARVVNALGGVLNERRADRAEKAGLASADDFLANNPVLSSLIGRGGSGVSVGVPSGVSKPRSEAEKIGDDTMRALGKTPEWLRYDNQAAIRNKPLDARLVNAMSFLPEMGITMDVVSGGQEAAGEGDRRTGSTRHDHGGAADVDFYKDGRKLDWNNPADLPIFQEIVRRAKANGVTGIGAGNEYMGAGRMHVGFGKPAVWGAGGKGENAPDWLKAAYTGASGGGSTPQGSPAPQGNVVAALAGAMSNPWVAQKYGPVIEAMLGQQMRRGDMEFQQQLQQQDPMYQAKLAQLTAPKPVDPFADTKVINGQLVTMTPEGPQVVGDFRTQDGGFRPLSPEESAQMGLPEGSFQVGPDGKISQIGGSRVVVNNNMGGTGPDLGKLSTDFGYVLDPETGKAKIDPQTGLPIAAPVPGSPAALEAQQISEKQAESDRQSNLKMGTTLENLNLNIKDLEDGGVPVTGVIGAIGSMIPGSHATDFRNRTNQINTRAALNEIQNMRDSSPTGGAVGQLTDAEREAIALAATSLANTSSKEEYLRSARNFRKLMLDTAFGEGNWKLTDDGRIALITEKPAAGDDGGWQTINGVKIRVKQ
jgi:hypothetical protein